MKRSAPLTRHRGLRPRSDKVTRVYREQRSSLVASVLAERRTCELGLPGCTRVATSVDERLSRARGGSITDPANLQASCWCCQVYKEDHPLLAIERGVAVHSWDKP